MNINIDIYILINVETAGVQTIFFQSILWKSLVHWRKVVMGRV